MPLSQALILRSVASSSVISSATSRRRVLPTMSRGLVAAIRARACAAASGSPGRCCRPGRPIRRAGNPIAGIDPLAAALTISGTADRVPSYLVVANAAFAALLVAPFLGEALSTSTPPLDLLLLWNLGLLAALYGSGAIICREVARRCGLGLASLCVLAAAYAVYEEALIVQFWFDPRYQDRVGVGSYSRVWHTNLLLATHLTAFHVAVSICSSVLLVERLFPAQRERAWAGQRGLALAAVALVLVVPLTYGNVARGPGRAEACCPRPACPAGSVRVPPPSSPPPAGRAAAAIQALPPRRRGVR
jgi:hypothetical protein